MGREQFFSPISEDTQTIKDTTNTIQNTVNELQQTDVANLRNPTNLIHLFNSDEWDFHNNITINSPTKITNENTTGNPEQAKIYIDCEPNTNYYGDCLAPVEANMNVATLDSSGNVISNRNVLNDNNAFTTESNAEQIRVNLYKNEIGTHVFENVMLHEGTTSKPFVPRKNSIATTEEKIGTNSDPEGSGTLFSRIKSVKSLEERFSNSEYKGLGETVNILSNTQINILDVTGEGFLYGSLGHAPNNSNMVVFIDGVKYLDVTISGGTNFKGIIVSSAVTSPNSDFNNSSLANPASSNRITSNWANAFIEVAPIKFNTSLQIYLENADSVAQDIEYSYHYRVK